MDGRFGDNSHSHDTEPETNAAGPPSYERKSTNLSSTSPSPKRSRRSVQKRVVSVPIADADGARSKGNSEGAPPSDSWAWRKYGQKPIKGSPYPRGYYRCSSSKGCPARKQVERSRVDPTMLVVTYSSEHNHPWPLPKNNHHTSNSSKSSGVVLEEDPTRIQQQSVIITGQAADVDDKFSDLIGEESTLMMRDDFWLSDVGSNSSTSPSAATDTLLYGPIFGSVTELAPGEYDKEEEEEEDSLFAGLGELPEYSVVFRRGYLQRQMRDDHTCSLEEDHVVRRTIAS